MLDSFDLSEIIEMTDNNPGFDKIIFDFTGRKLVFQLSLGLEFSVPLDNLEAAIAQMASIGDIINSGDTDDNESE